MMISLGNSQDLCPFVPFDRHWVWSLSKLCNVQHCKAGWAQPVFYILGKDKRDPNETQTRQYLAVWMFLNVSISKQSNQIEAIGYGIASIWMAPGKYAKTQISVVWSPVASLNPPYRGQGMKKSVRVGRYTCFWSSLWVFRGKMLSSTNFVSNRSNC